MEDICFGGKLSKDMWKENEFSIKMVIVSLIVMFLSAVDDSNFSFNPKTLS